MSHLRRFIHRPEHPQTTLKLHVPSVVSVIIPWVRSRLDSFFIGSITALDRMIETNIGDVNPKAADVESGQSFGG